MTDNFDVPIPRDRWGRPLVTPPDGGKPIAYTRCTTFVGALEDTYNLEKWKMRMVALGLADRKDLILSVAAHRADKDELNRIADAALEAAQASAAATTGTALHALTHQQDQGLDLGIIPAEAEADLRAYRLTTGSLRYAGMEQFRVCDELKVGGTTDRVVDLGDLLLIDDIKTGSIDYALHKIAMQLAVYAHSVPYDWQTNTRIPDPKPMDLERALIVHLPAGKAECTLHWVDIAAGWEAVKLAKQVRDWRSRKGLARVATDIGGVARTPDLFAVIAAHTDVSALREWYMALAPADKSPKLLAACQARKAEITGGAA